MSSVGWWEPNVADELSQGDIFENVPFLMPLHPAEYMETRPLKNNEIGWVKSPQKKIIKGTQHILASAKTGLGMILNHGCDIEKSQKLTKPRYTICFVDTLQNLSDAEQDKVRTQKPFHQLYLPEVPGYGDCYINLRLTCVLPGQAIDELQRIASMTDLARTRLHAQILAFYSRLDLSQIK